LLAGSLAAAAFIAYRYGSDPQLFRLPSGQTSGDDVVTPQPSAPHRATQTPGSPQPARTGPGLTEPGIHLVATPLADGTFEVAESAIMRAPLAGLTLALPRQSYGGTTFPRAAAGQVQLTADGRPFTVGQLNKGDQFTLTDAVGRVNLRYQLTGVTVRSVPSVAGRALAVLAPLTMRADETLPVSVTVRGTTVRNLVCPRLPAARQQCAPAIGSPGTIQPLSARDAVVVVQLDLPQPS
jgi:hypothetical protein